MLRYDLGDTIEVDQQAKENRNINQTVKDQWTPSTAGRLERRAKLDVHTPKQEEENLQAIFQNF